MIVDQIKQEEARQKKVINLIASENIVSDAVKAALGSSLTNKYAEGYPGARYYGGLAVIDELETEVQNLARKVFKTNYHVNVQAYSGSIANLAVYNGFLEPGDNFMGLELSHGGHLTHGHPVTLSGKLFNRTTYFVNKDTFLIDYDELERKAIETKPKLIISGASAYPRKIDLERIGKIAKNVGSLHMADISHIAGLIATGLHQSPFGHADFVMATTHKTLRGPRGALLFCRPQFAKQLDKSVFPGLQGGPHMNNIAAIGICLEEALLPSFTDYAKNVVENAKVLAKELAGHGLTVLTSGTDTHLLMLDLRPQGISGQEAQDNLEAENIIVNKNTIPYDDASPRNPNGLRIGTAAISSAGMLPKDMPELAEKIAKIIVKG